MDIRNATPGDAAQICRVVRASIVELCYADHQADPGILERWLANKTPDNVSRWLSNPANMNLVAAEGDVLLAAGCVTTSGEIILNYVSPAARFRGVSSRLLVAMEASALRQGVRRCVLDSTATAHRFYQSRGYRDAGTPRTKHGLAAFPMVKVVESDAEARRPT